MNNTKRKNLTFHDLIEKSIVPEQYEKRQAEERARQEAEAHQSSCQKLLNATKKFFSLDNKHVSYQKKTSPAGHKLPDIPDNIDYNFNDKEYE